MSKTLIKDVKVWTGEQFTTDNDILVENGTITEVRENIEQHDASVIDGNGALAMPGLVDLRAHTGEPGHDRRETTETLMQAAAAGGFTHVLVMPDTDPPIDNEHMVTSLIQKASALSGPKLHVCAALTKNREGHLLTEMAYLKRAGAVAVGDVASLKRGRLLRNAIQYADMLDMPVFLVAGDEQLKGEGVAIESELASALGLRTIPLESEWVGVAEKLLTAEALGAPIHLQGVSMKKSVDMIRQAKERSVRVTADCSLLNLILSEQAIARFDSSARLEPCLKYEEDRVALIEGIRSGIIDCIVTGHRPLTLEEADRPFEEALPGAAGLETALSAIYTYAVKPSLIGWEEVIKTMSENPRKILGLPQASIEPGNVADITLFQPDATWIVDPNQWFSKGVNTPLEGQHLSGKVTATMRGDLYNG